VDPEPEGELFDNSKEPDMADEAAFGDCPINSSFVEVKNGEISTWLGCRDPGGD